VFITESELRELWQNGRQPLPVFPPGTRFSPAAQDFLKDHSLTVQFAAPEPVLPAAAVGPPALQTRLTALHTLTALAAAQARHFRLLALAAQLDALAGELTSSPARPLSLPSPLLPSANPPPFTTDHLIPHWLRWLRAEAGTLAMSAREQGETGRALSARLEDYCTALLALERRFLSGELAWTVTPG